MANLRNLKSFGDIAAEDDSVLDYFLSTDAVSEVNSGSRVLVLGRKGSGKTALVRHFTETNQRDHGKPLSLRNYPWGTHESLVDKGASSNEAYVASWRLLIAIRLASMVAERGATVYTDSIEALRKFLMRNFQSLDPDSRSILAQPKLSASGLTIAPSIAGFSLGSITFGDPSRDKVLGLELHSMSNSILRDVTTAISELGIQRLFLHFDELDQGMDIVDSVRSKMLIGLILAAREISNSKDFRANICPIVYLRTDIWDQLDFSDKNKITQSGAITLGWDDESLQKMINLRLQAKIGVSASWNTVADNQKMRGSQAKWNHILARTFLRPRDVIQFLNEALAVAKKRSDDLLILGNEDINAARERYSVYLKDELSDEINPHWKHWLEAVQACSRISTVTFTKDVFLKNYRETKSKDNPHDAEAALEQLYRFSVIGYERRFGRGGSAFSFRYVDTAAGWDTSAPRYKVHLGLKEFAQLKEERT